MHIKGIQLMQNKKKLDVRNNNFEINNLYYLFPTFKELATVLIY